METYIMPMEIADRFMDWARPYAEDVGEYFRKASERSASTDTTSTKEESISPTKGDFLASLSKSVGDMSKDAKGKALSLPKLSLQEGQSSQTSIARSQASSASAVTSTDYDGFNSKWLAIAKQHARIKD